MNKKKLPANVTYYGIVVCLILGLWTIMGCNNPLSDFNDSSVQTIEPGNESRGTTVFDDTKIVPHVKDSQSGLIIEFGLLDNNYVTVTKELSYSTSHAVMKAQMKKLHLYWSVFQRLNSHRVKWVELDIKHTCGTSTSSSLKNRLPINNGGVTGPLSSAKYDLAEFTNLAWTDYTTYSPASHTVTITLRVNYDVYKEVQVDTKRVWIFYPFIYVDEPIYEWKYDKNVTKPIDSTIDFK
jgi:hypothetical protein